MCETCHASVEECSCICSRGLIKKCYPCMRYAARVLEDEHTLKAEIKRRRKMAELAARKAQPKLF